MNSDSSDISDLLRHASTGDQAATNRLFEQYRGRLKRMIRLRMNRQLQGRVDASDILQDVFLDASRRLPDYLKAPQAPFFLWLRRLASHRLIDAHRRHLGAQARNAQREISLHRGPLPPADSISLAAQLLGQLTSPSGAAIRAEVRIGLQEALNTMDDLDREILALRHFEHLSNAEAAEELGIQTSAASKRYVRALRRLQEVLAKLGMIDDDEN